MCLFTKQKRCKIAKQDIFGYKRVKKKDNILASPYRSFVWKPKKIETAKSFRRTTATGQVNHGFHCYRDLDVAKDYRDFGEIIVKVTIPKGARYYENHKEYCSDMMIVTSDKSLINY